MRTVEQLTADLMVATEARLLAEAQRDEARDQAQEAAGKLAQTRESLRAILESIE